MSNWLGFSVTPHMRIEEGFGRDENQGSYSSHMSVMPLRSDGSLCVIDPFRRSSTVAEDWRYDNGMGASNPNGEGPKLEDFLGCCYSNSPSDDTKVYCQTQQDRINVNIPPPTNFNNNNGQIENNNLTDPSPVIENNPAVVGAMSAQQSSDGEEKKPSQKFDFIQSYKHKLRFSCRCCHVLSGIVWD